MAYDPRACGARCDRCPLNGRPVVPPERHPGAQTVLVAEAPGQDEEISGRPLTGPSGIELNIALALNGRARTDFHITNVLLCRPVGSTDAKENELKKLIKWVEKQNETIADPAEKWLNPVEACLPRLAKELAPYRQVIPLGTIALQAIVGGAGGITDRRGQLNRLIAPDGVETKILPTFNPAYVRRFKRWRQVFRVDLARAFRWFEDRLEWKDPPQVHNPTAEELEAFLFDPTIPFHSVDVETRATRFDEDDKPLFDPLWDELRCIGFGSQERAMVVGVRSKIDSTFLWRENQTEFVKILWVIKRWLEDQTRVKVGHNSLYYDWQVIESFFRQVNAPVTIRSMEDTMLGHRVIDPDMPHGLGFVGSVYTDVHAWKAGDPAVDARLTDKELWTYNGLDDVVTAQVAPRIFATVAEQQVDRAYQSDVGMTEVCRGLHRVGMWVHQGIRAIWDRTLLEDEARWTNEVYRLVEQKHPGLVDRFNPRGLADAEREFLRRERMSEKRRAEEDNEKRLNIRSRDQIGRLLYQILDWPIAEHVQAQELYTESGDRSTNDTVLRAYVSDPRLTQDDRRLAHALRMARRARKNWGTYAVKLRPLRPGEPPPKGNVMYPDGRFHSDWNAGRTGPGRLASTNPNAQNWSNYDHPTISNVALAADDSVQILGKGESPPDGSYLIRGLAFKHMIAAPPGRLLCGIDADALHLRIIGSRWNIPSLQEAFLQPRKWRGQKMGPHESFAAMLFGDAFLGSPHGTWPTENPEGKWKGPAKAMRDVSKTVRYAGAYRADVSTIFREVTSVEDKKTGELIFAHYTEQKVEDLYETWMTKEPEWQRAWTMEVDLWKNQGFIADPILGRKLWFRDEKETEIINGPILLTEAAIMHAVTQDFCKAVPFEYAGVSTGLINQCHDSLTAEVADRGQGVQHEADRVAGIMNEVMNRSFQGLTIPIMGKAATGRTWQEV